MSLPTNLKENSKNMISEWKCTNFRRFQSTFAGLATAYEEFFAQIVAHLPIASIQLVRFGMIVEICCQNVNVTN